MPGLYGITGNTTVSVYNTTGLYNVGNGNVIVGNVNSANTTGLYQAFGNPVILNSAQTLYTLLSESGNVNFALTNGNTQVLAYFTGPTSVYSNANVAAFLPTYTGNVNAAYFTGNGYYLTGVVSSGGTNYSNANVAAYLPIYSGNVSAAYVLTNNIYYANGAPYVFGSTYSNANVTAYLPTDPTIQSIEANVTAANAAIVAVQTNLTNYETYANAQIASTNANLTAFETYANTHFGTSSYSNANVTAYLAAGTDPTILGIDANVTAANAAIVVVQNNLTSYETYANAQIASTNANLTAFETYANIHFGDSNYGNANVAAYLPTYTGNIGAGNISASGVIVGGNIFANTALFSAIANIGYIDYALQNSTVTTAKGSMWYNNSTNIDGIVYYNSQGQVLVGQQTFFKAYNNTGSTIPAGQVVYVNGQYIGQYPTIANAIATTTTTSLVIGITPYAINNASFGEVITAGRITTLSGLPYTTGTDLFLSATTAGALTSTQPANPNYAIQVGVAISSSEILLQPTYISVNANNVIGAFGNVTALNMYTQGNLITTTGIFWANGVDYSSTATGTYSNANVAAYLAAGTDPTILGIDANVVAANAAIALVQTNLTAFETASNANVGAIYTHLGTLDANVGAFEIYSNANAASQAVAINSLNANVGAFETYANANIGTIYTHLNTLDANVGAYEVYANTQIATITANLGTLYLGNISTQANLGAFETYANARFVTDNANITAANTAIATLNANVGAFETYANIKFSTIGGNIISTAPITIESNVTGGTGQINLIAQDNGLNNGNIDMSAQTVEIDLYTGGQFLITQAQPGATTTIQTSTVNMTGNVTVGNITAATGITANYFYGNGSQLTGIVSNYGNVQAAALIDSGTIPAAFTTLNTTGQNIFSGNLSVQGVGTIGSSAIALYVSSGDAKIVGTTQAGNLITGNGVFWSNGVSYLADLYANAATQQTAINTINANLGAFETYANANIGTLYTRLNTLDANVGAYEIANNANVGTIYTHLNTLDANVGAYEIATNANLGAYQIYANTQISTINANLGAFETYANATFGTSTFGNANVFQFLYANTGITSSNLFTILGGAGGALTAAGNLNLWGNPQINLGSSYGLSESVEQSYGAVKLNTVGNLTIQVQGSGSGTDTSNDLILQTVGSFSNPTGASGNIIVNTRNLDVNANLVVSGSSSFANLVTTNGFYTTNGNVQANLIVATDGLFLSNSNIGAFSYGALSYSDVDIFASYSTSQNSYAQLIMQNTNAGGSASVDLIVSNDKGNATAYYGDFGINSSGFNTGTGSLGLPNATYVYGQNSDLVLGTTTANAIHFVTNTGATDAATIYANNVSKFANIITTNGVYWSNGAAYSTGGGGGSSTSIVNGTSNVSILTANANITMFSNTGVIDARLTTGAFVLPTGGNSLRPTANAAGSIRFNTCRGNPEWYSAVDGTWKLFSQTYTPPTPTYTISYLVVAGGGGGGWRQNGSGGGGAGGLLTGCATVTQGTTYTTTVGAGGATSTPSNAYNGSNSTLTGSGFPSITAIGGGYGGSGQGPSVYCGATGGSGGGGADKESNSPLAYRGGAGTPGQGYAGGNGGYLPSTQTGGGGGGGGAGGAGVTWTTTQAGNGGVGLQSSITGTAVYYGGGGGGGEDLRTYSPGGLTTSGAGNGGSGGGGNGAGFVVGSSPATTRVATGGTTNTGGGGGGGNYSNPGYNCAGAGGSGVVILSIPSANYSGNSSVTGPYTYGVNGPSIVITWTGSGSYTA